MVYEQKRLGEEDKSDAEEVVESEDGRVPRTIKINESVLVSSRRALVVSRFEFHLL